ncbi:MAG: hypothetical protein KAT18_06490 [Candidatus Latescibacteria bacterium]|nr:hypothetical protein [Candidatus Latescibacterota bacterium]
MKPQKVKVFANSNVVGLEKEMNAWLRGTSPQAFITEAQMTGWGEGGGAGEYTVVCVVIYE